MIKTHHRITIYSQSYPHMSREIILNVRQKEIQRKTPLIWMCSPMTAQPDVWNKPSYLTVENTMKAVLSKRNPQGTADYTSNPGWDQIRTSLYFSWWELKVRKSKHAAGPRILLQEASDAIARNRPSLNHPFTVWLVAWLSSLYFVTTTVGLAFR